MRMFNKPARVVHKVVFKSEDEANRFANDTIIFTYRTRFAIVGINSAIADGATVRFHMVLITDNGVSDEEDIVINAVDEYLHGTDVDHESIVFTPALLVDMGDVLRAVYSWGYQDGVDDIVMDDDPLDATYMHRSRLMSEYPRAYFDKYPMPTFGGA